MKNMKLCQSCGMPLETETQKGTNKDGSRSDKYCVYCYAEGHFTADITADEMIENNLKYLDEWNNGMGKRYTVAEAREQLKKFIPTLERWR